MRLLWTLCGLSCAVLAVLPYSHPPSQSVPPCELCRISLDRVATIGRDTDSLSLGPNSSVDALSNGNYVATVGVRTNTYTAIAAYSPVGTVVGVVGRPGPGPGEFTNISLLRVGKGDSIFVYDAGKRAVSVYTRELAPAARIHIPSMQLDDFRPLSDGTLLAHGYIQTSDKAGWPLHIIDRSGAVLRSFGADTPRFDPRPGAMNGRVLAKGPVDTICAAHQNRYRIECWSASGAKSGIVERTVAWFAPWEQFVIAMYDQKRVEPDVAYNGLYRDASGRFWTVIEVADENWSYRRTEDRPPPGQSGLASDTWISDLEKFVDTYYEVLDSRTGAVLASQRDGGIAGRFMSNGRVIRMRETEIGAVVADVLAPRIVRP